MYTTGFFVDSNAEAVNKVCEFAAANNKKLAFNLSAVFVVQFFMEQVKKVLKYADFVFCNEDEASAFAKAEGLEEKDYEGVGKLIAGLEKANSEPRHVIITLGPEPALLVTCVNGETTVERTTVFKVGDDAIVDTNGAGDAFVGGFMAELSREYNIQAACTEGSRLASKVIQKSGCVFE